MYAEKEPEFKKNRKFLKKEARGQNQKIKSGNKLKQANSALHGWGGKKTLSHGAEWMVKR